MKIIRQKSLTDGNWYVMAIEGNQYTWCTVEPLFDDQADPPESLLAAKEEMCRLHLQEILSA